MIKDKKIIVNEEDLHFINSKANSINETVNVSISEISDSEEISPHTPPSTKASAFGYKEVNEPASQEGGSFSSSYPDALIAQFISVGKMADSLAELNRLLQEERSRNSILLEENYSLKLKLGAMAVNNAEKEPDPDNTRTRIADDSSKNNNSNNSNDSNNRNKSILSSKENNQKKIKEKESKKVGAVGQTSESQNNQPIESNSESQTMNINNSKKQKRKANNNNQKPTNTTMNDENIETPNEASDTQQTNELRKPWEWKKDTVLIVGDSMISNINENTLSRRYQTKVRSFQRSTIKDLHDYIKPLLKKKPDKIVLVIGTNDMVNEKLPDILKSLKSLVDQILEALPECDVVVSEVIVRSDNASLNGKITNFNKALKTMNVDILRQQNITKNHLGKRGLHLNFSGNLQLARNLIEKNSPFLAIRIIRYLSSR